MADIRGLEAKHYVLIAGFLTSLSVQLAGTQHGWHDVFTPIFVSGFLMQVATFIGALYAGAPGATGEKVDRANPEQLPEATGVEGISPVKDPGRFNVPPPPFSIWFLIASLSLGSAIGFSACAGANKVPATITTPAGVHDYRADLAVERLREISNVVKAGANDGIIKVADAFTIIEWISGDAHAKPQPTLGILQLIGSSGEGWKTTVRQAWEGRIRGIFLQYPSLAPYVDIVGDLLKEVL